MLKKTYFIFVSIAVILLCTSSSYKNRESTLYSIKEQNLNLYELIHFSKKSSNQTIKAFEISQQVSYKEYKVYLNEIKKDSSLSYYKSQLPDKRIGSAEIYNEYLTSNKYDNYPVLGISWDNAMNYCKWKTIKDNKDSIRFVYRLPHCSEWLAANYHLNTNKIKNDFNENYADWLINTFDESNYYVEDYVTNDFKFDYMYFHKPKDQKALKRKLVIGNSFLYQQEYPLANNFSFYATDGYKHISFRYVKEYIRKSEHNTSSRLIEHWKIKAK
jgi:hypothetical protein